MPRKLESPKKEPLPPIRGAQAISPAPTRHVGKLQHLEVTSAQEHLPPLTLSKKAALPPIEGFKPHPPTRPKTLKLEPIKLESIAVDVVAPKPATPPSLDYRVALKYTPKIVHIGQETTIQREFEIEWADKSNHSVAPAALFEPKRFDESAKNAQKRIARELTKFNYGDKLAHIPPEIKPIVASLACGHMPSARKLSRLANMLGCHLISCDLDKNPYFHNARFVIARSAMLQMLEIAGYLAGNKFAQPEYKETFAGAELIACRSQIADIAAYLRNHDGTKQDESYVPTGVDFYSDQLPGEGDWQARDRIIRTFEHERTKPTVRNIGTHMRHDIARLVVGEARGPELTNGLTTDIDLTLEEIYKKTGPRHACDALALETLGVLKEIVQHGKALFNKVRHYEIATNNGKGAEVEFAIIEDTLAMHYQAIIDSHTNTDK